MEHLKVDIPENIEKWMNEQDGVNLAVNFNKASADYGYAHVTWISVVISMLTRTCNRCGYDRLWKPDDIESRCGRHTYSAWRYDEVFVYSNQVNPLSLEEAFNDWLEAQPKQYYKPVVKKRYGQFDWS